MLSVADSEEAPLLKSAKYKLMANISLVNLITLAEICLILGIYINFFCHTATFASDTRCQRNIHVLVLHLGHKKSDIYIFLLLCTSSDSIYY